MLVFDPICALATPPGAAGLAIIRLSGERCIHIADQCFDGKTPLCEALSHTIHYGTFRRGTTPIDKVTAFIYRAPHSYTGEDTVEFGCHGGRIVAHEVVEALIEAGARHAEPGEFTKRAFLNQKLDLTQAEAVGDLIHAVSEQGSHAAAQQLMGGFTRRLAELREKLLELCGLLELELDFSQEDIELIDKHLLAERILNARFYCSELADSHRSAEILRSGYSVGIVGYPNAGKSSLLNTLLGKQRAIVSEIAGTTRDYIEESLYIGSTAVRLIDTAGFRTSTDIIEIEGIRLAESLLAECHLILVLNDSTQGAAHSDILFERLTAGFPHSSIVLIHTKTDITYQQEHPPENDSQLLQTYQREELFISVVTGEGIDTLKQYIQDKARNSTHFVHDALINARQAALLQQAAASLSKAEYAVRQGVSNEFAAIDLREALRRIGEITGEVWNEEILNAVFAKFCIGK